MRISRGGSGSVALLSAEEERCLARQIEAGVLAAECQQRGELPYGASEAELRVLVEQGERARHRFVEANLRLVAMVAGQQAARAGLSEPDLFQEGCLGLMHAVARFDWRRGCRFSTYALYWVRAHVGAATAGLLGGLNLSGSRAAQLRSARGVESALSQTLGRPPTAAELAAALGRSERWISALLAHARPLPLGDLEAEPAASWVVGLQDTDAGAVAAGRPGVELLEHLTGLERRVIELRLGFGCDQPYGYAEVARQLQTTAARVRRAEARALERLRAVCPQQARAHL